MKTKNLKLSLLILTGLVILSYGFLISAQEGFNSSANVVTNPTTADASAAASSDTNMTTDVAQKLSAIATNPDSSAQQVSLTDLQKSISDSVNKSFSESDLPKISADKIKIKKQDYTGSADKIKAKKKEDFINYMAAVYYIFSSNSPKPIASNSDVLSAFNNTLIDVVTSIGARQSKSLDDLQKSGAKIFDQMQQIEVPADLVDVHIKGLEFAQYAMLSKNTIAPNTDDPLLDLANLAKLEGFVESFSGFFDEVQTKFSDYGIEYDSSLMQKLNSLGAPAPDPTDLEKAASEILKNNPAAAGSSATDNSSADAATNTDSNAN